MICFAPGADIERTLRHAGCAPVAEVTGNAKSKTPALALAAALRTSYRVTKVEVMAANPSSPLNATLLSP
jgi:hypothetical protein